MIDQILHLKEVISKQDREVLIAEFESRKNFSEKEKCLHANTGLDVVSTYDKVDLIPDSYTYKLLFNKTQFMITNWLEQLNKLNSVHIPLLRIYLKCSHRYRLMKYGVGGWIHPHIDGNPFIYASCTFQLNDEFTGGNFSFWNGKHTFKMKAGDGLIFPAGPFWVHEVTNINSGARYSVNSFILSCSPDLYEKSEVLMNYSLKNIQVYNSD